MPDLERAISRPRKKRMPEVNCLTELISLKSMPANTISSTYTSKEVNLEPMDLTIEE